MSKEQEAKILVVEDDADLQLAYSMILSSQGHRVKVAGDGIEGLNALHDFKPDVILLDYFMPRMDGKGFLENYDAALLPGTKVVVMSNIADQSALEETLTLGAHRFVSKSDLSPVDLVRLVDELVVS